MYSTVLCILLISFKGIYLQETDFTPTTITSIDLDSISYDENIEPASEAVHIKGKFVGLSHALSSGYVHILKNDTIFIQNFNYDGLSPDAHFILGIGKLDYDNGIVILDENGSTKKLKAYNNVNVTLQIEHNPTEYDWLGVWCSLDKEIIGYVLFNASDSESAQIITNIGHRKHDEVEEEDADEDTFLVATVKNSEEPMKILSQFLNVSHGIKSGNLQIINETTIYIPNLYYDGNIPEVYFWVGTGTEPSEDGQQIIYDANILPPFHNSNITLILPEDVTVNDIEWFSIWDVPNKRSYGNVFIHNEINETFVQISPLMPDSNFRYNIHSGPIIIVDTHTIFITNLHYNGQAPDAHFWAGSGDNGPDENGHLLTGEYNSTKPLGTYSGEDIYLILPENLNIRNMDYLCIWSSSLKSSLGSTNITKDLSSIPEANGLYQYNEEGIYISRLPKCCPRNQVKTAKGCINRITSTFPISVYEGNMSYLNDEPMKQIIFKPYVYQPNCEHGMFRIDQSEEFYLLTMGVIILADGVIVTKDKFCYDVSQIQIDENTRIWEENIFMCFEGDHVPEFLNTLIVSCIYISSFFLIITSIIFIVIKEARAERGTNVMGYTTMMSLSFVCLATARILHINGSLCTILGFTYQFFLVSSFTWLLCLTCDIFYQVWRFEKNYYNKRYMYFALFAVGLPIAAVIISIFINNTVPSKYVKPAFGYEPCWFRSNKKVIFYYLPIAISIILNITFISFTWLKIKKLQTKPNWTIRARGIKNVFRSCYLILGIMTICWTAEFISYYFETNNGLWIAIDVIDSLQGVFVFLVFVMHDPVIGILQNRFNLSRKNRIEKIDLFDFPPRPPSEHGALLSRIQHASSMEDLNS